MTDDIESTDPLAERLQQWQASRPWAQGSRPADDDIILAATKAAHRRHPEGGEEIVDEVLTRIDRANGHLADDERAVVSKQWRHASYPAKVALFTAHNPGIPVNSAVVERWVRENAADRFGQQRASAELADLADELVRPDPQPAADLGHAFVNAFPEEDRIAVRADLADWESARPWTKQAHPDYPRFANAARSVLAGTSDAAIAGERIDRIMGKAGALSAQEEHVARQLFRGDPDPIGRYRRGKTATAVGTR